MVLRPGEEGASGGGSGWLCAGLSHGRSGTGVSNAESLVFLMRGFRAGVGLAA